jgi:hypothetical protein
MMRALTVTAALLLGLVGLLMSLCGGGFFITFAFKDSGIALLALASGLIGLALLWGARRLLLKATRKEPGGPDSQ